MQNRYIFFSFLLIFALNGSKIRAQSPVSTNFSTEDFGAHKQNWGGLVDKRGVVYLANGAGILEFDGVSANLITTEKNAIIRSIAMDSEGRIFAGATGDFGYLAYDKTGKSFFVSLKNKLKEEDLNFGEAWETHCSKKEVLFITNDKLFVYRNDSVQVFPFEFSPVFSFSAYDRVFAAQKAGGLFVFEKNGFRLIPGTEKYMKKGVRRIIIPFKNNKLLVKTTGKIYIIDLNPYVDSKSKNFNFSDLSKPVLVDSLESEVETYLAKNGLYSGTKISDNRFVFNTVRGGSIVIDDKGKVVSILDKTSGMRDNTVWYSFADKRENLWLCLNDGLAYAETGNPITKFDEHSGLSGYVYSTTVFNGLRYASTIQGIFYKKENDIFSKFKPVKGVADYCWDFVVFGNKLIATGSTGIIQITDSSAVDIHPADRMYKFAKSALHKDRLYMGLTDGFALALADTNSYAKTRLKIVRYFRLKEMKAAVRNIYEDTDGNLWLTTKYEGVFRVRFSGNDIEKYQIDNYGKEQGLPFEESNFVIPYHGKIYIGTKIGIYEPVFEGNIVKTFRKTALFGNNFDDSKFNTLQIEDDKYGIFINTISFSGILRKDETGSYALSQKELCRIPPNELIINESDQILSACTKRGLFFFDKTTAKTYSVPYTALIRKIILSEDSVLFRGNFPKKSASTDTALMSSGSPGEDFPHIFPYALNSITFEFSATAFEGGKTVQYQYVLEGFSKKWSDLSSETKAVFTNLNEGTYTFKVRAVDIFGNLSEESSYVFTIESPWYRTIYAYILYFFIFTGVVLFTARAYSKKLRRDNIKLEEIITERTAEIVKQKGEIQAQADELEAFNAELEKLSVVASETDNSVMIIDKDGNFEWVNNSFKRIYGMSLEEFKQRHGSNIRETSVNPDILNLIKQATENKKSVSYDSTFTPDSGVQVWLQTTLTPILTLDGQLKKLIAVESDITEIKKAEFEIFKQKEELQYKNTQINSSINYAKTIQFAMLPTESEIGQYFENFVLYRPKDIVSGDFYQTFPIFENGQLKYFFFIVVDCTGHGVPGAFMSMIGIRLLREIIIEQNILEPDAILETMNSEVVKALNQSNNGNSDGMDAAILRINPTGNNAFQMAFAGAKLPLWCLKNKESVLNVMKGNRKSIGGIYGRKAREHFDCRYFEAGKGDVFYLFSDGIIDQSNNDRVRLGSEHLQKIVENSASKNLKTQKEFIIEELSKWQNDSAQRDDITMCAVKL